MAARDEHLKMIAELRAKGTNMIFGSAIMDDDDKMIGSVISAQFPSPRAEFDAWLKVEPYVNHKVWDKITVHGSKLAPTLCRFTKKAS